MHVYILTNDSLLILTNYRPVLSSERALHMYRTVTFLQEEISGHEPRKGLDTKTD
jgi:hypothetical protein